MVGTTFLAFNMDPGFTLTLSNDSGFWQTVEAALMTSEMPTPSPEVSAMAEVIAPSDDRVSASCLMGEGLAGFMIGWRMTGVVGFSSNFLAGSTDGAAVAHRVMSGTLSEI